MARAFGPHAVSLWIFRKPCKSDFGLAPGITVKSACILIHKKKFIFQYLATWLHGMKNMIGLEFKVTGVHICTYAFVL